MSKLLNIVMIFSIILGMFIPVTFVNASNDKVLLIRASDHTIKESTNFSSKTLKTLDQGNSFPLVKELSSNSSCPGKWYEVEFESNKTGFVCDLGSRTVVANSGVNVRSGPGTNHSTVGAIAKNSTFNVKGIEPSGNGCAGPWLKINYKNADGFVCSKTSIDLVSSHRSTVEVVTISSSLDNFPVSYRAQLTALQNKYPQWEFVPQHVDMKFDDFVQEQYSAALDRNLVWIQNSWGWVRESTFEFDTGKFDSNHSGGGTDVWFVPSREKLSYIMDPRNFLNEEQIFAFEDIAFDPIFHKKEGVQAMLDGTFMEGKPTITKTDRDHGKSYAEIFMEAATPDEDDIKSGFPGLSPYSLVARVIQEVGRGIPNRNIMVSGNHPDYKNYFNFYNIGATGPIDQIVRNGLEYAKRQGWNNERAAILGGANTTLRGYFERGQTTKYAQKYNFLPNSSAQYMQNIYAPYSESRVMFRRYEENDLLNRKIIFRIPVFKDMPSSNPLPDSRSSINYLQELKVNGDEHKTFDPQKHEYNITTARSSITFDGKAYDIAKSVSGFRTVNLTKENTVHKISVEAANGDVRTYTFNIRRLFDVDMTVEDIVKKASLKTNNGNIENIKIGRTVKDIKETVLSEAPLAEVSFRDSNGQSKTSGRVSTGDRITIKHGEDSKSYVVVIKGDVVGNGRIEILDLLRLRRYLTNDINLSEVYLKAADVNGDGKVDLLDLLRLRNILLDSL